jgi:hypothetical protein
MRAVPIRPSALPRGALLRVLAVLLPIAALSAVPSRSGVAVFHGSGAPDTLFTLPVTWVVLDSVMIFRNGEPIAEFRDWRIAEPGNRIWVYHPLLAGDSLRVEYVYRAVPLYRSYSRRSLRDILRARPDSAGLDTARIAFAPPTENRETEGWTRLSKSGSLIRSVQVGTGQDLQLESALNLQIQGRVGRDVDVVAALTDQSTPIQPEGTTETISELEKVFISVRTPRFSATLGDYTLDLAGGQYDTYSRKLTGVMGQAALGPASLTAGGAVSRGQFFTNSFYGQEANQGPYPLHGRNGEIGIIVLAGTETVWLDGVVLRRGEGNDYVIDYASGEISFTSRRLITSDSRIVVDFEYSTEEYERFYGAGKAEVRFGGERAGGSVTWITESDDRTRPIGLGLKDEDRALLAAAGDSAGAAVSPTADSIGVQGGDYVRRDTLYGDTTYTVFVFSPRDSLNRPTGQWRVSFGDFGLGNGDYEAAADSLGLSYFRWLGPSRGRYRPFRRLPLPQQHTLADVRVHGSPLRGLTMQGEFAGSRRDLNSSSSIGDGDNDGAAYVISAEFAREQPKLLWVRPQRIELGGRLRHRDRRFVELSRVSEVEFERDWDVAGNTGFEETIREANLKFSPLSALTLLGGYGDLRRGDAFSSRRRSVGGNLTVLRKWSVAVSHLTLQSDDSASGRRGNWMRQGGRVNGRLWRLAPRFTVDRERKRDRIGSGYGGFRFLDWSAGTDVDLPAHLAVSGGYQRRTDDLLAPEGVFHRSADARTVSSEGSWSPPEIGRVLLRYAHREKDYAASDSADVTSDVGHLEALITPRSRIVEANAVYDVAKTRTQNQILVALQVPDGTGNYRREGDQYVPDDQGNYILVPRYTGSYEPVTEISFSSLVSLRPDELPPEKASALVRALSLESELTIEERTRLPLSGRLLLLDPSRFRGDSTLLGNAAFRQDVNVWRLSQKLALRLRYRESHSLQNQFLNGGQSRALREAGARVRARYGQFWRGESEADWSTETIRYGARTAPDRDVNRLDLSQINTVALGRRWETGIDLKFGEARDELTATQVSLREVTPHAALILLGKGRFDADAAWIHAASNQSLVPYELGRGANRGENYRWSARGTYQFGQNFSGSLNYTGRRDAGEKTYHTGRLEVRAYL